MRSLYDEPLYYRMLFDGRGHDLPFYQAVAGSAPARILELGVGSGRIALPLARDGHRVTGVDTSREMLDELESQLAREPPEVAARVTLVHGDARTIRVDGRFDRVLCPFNGLAHHESNEELLEVLRRARDHLAPGGRFAFDVNLPDANLLSGAGGSVPWLRHPRTGEAARCDEVTAYDPFAQVLTITTTLRAMERDEPPDVLTLRLRQLFPEETRLLLLAAGLELEWRTSTFAPPGSTSPDLAWDGLAREPEDARGDALAYVCR